MKTIQFEDAVDGTIITAGREVGGIGRFLVFRVEGTGADWSGMFLDVEPFAFDAKEAEDIARSLQHHQPNGWRLVVAPNAELTAALAEALA